MTAAAEKEHGGRRKRVQSPFRKRLLPLVGPFARHVDFADDGTFHCMEVPCGRP